VVSSPCVDGEPRKKEQSFKLLVRKSSTKNLSEQTKEQGRKVLPTKEK